MYFLYLYDVLEMDNFLISILASIYLVISMSIITDHIKKKGVIEFLHPVIFLLFYWGIPFCLEPLIIAFDIISPDWFLIRSGGNTRYIPYLQIQAIISVIFLYCGFNFCFRNRPTNQHNTTDNSTSKIPERKWEKLSGILGVIISFSMDIVYIYYTDITGSSIVATEGYGFPPTVFYFLKLFGHAIYGQFMTLCGTLSILLILFSTSMDKIKIRSFLLLSITFYMTLGILTFHKLRLMMPFIILIYSFYYWQRTMNIKREMLSVIFILALITLFPIILTGRGEYSKTDYRIINGFNKDEILYLVNKMKPEDFLYVLTRFESLDNATVICSQTPSVIPYKYGQSYLEGIINIPGIIPRLAPEGAGTFTNRFAREYSLIPLFDIKSGITLTQISEVYMNFGIYFIPIVMFLYGIFYKKIYYYMVNGKSDNAKFISFYLWFIWVMMHPGFPFESTIISLIKDGYGVAMILLIINLPSKLLNRTDQRRSQ